MFELVVSCIVVLIHSSRVLCAESTCEITTIGAGGVDDVAGTAEFCEEVLKALDDYPSITCYEDCYEISGLSEGFKILPYDSDGIVRSICSRIREQGKLYGAGDGCNSLVCLGGGVEFINANLDSLPYNDESCGGNIVVDDDPPNETGSSCTVGSFSAFPLQEGPSSTRTLCDMVKKVSRDLEGEVGSYPTICCVGSSAGIAVCPSSGQMSCDGSETVYDHSDISGELCTNALPRFQNEEGYSSNCNCVGCYWEDVATGVLLTRVDVFSDARPQFGQIGQVGEEPSEP